MSALQENACLKRMIPSSDTTEGDLYFYRVDRGLHGRVEVIDTAACPLYRLTGEYDSFCTPEDTLRAAAAIKGVRRQGDARSLPMSENREPFRRYIAPILDQILGQTKFSQQGVQV